MTLASIQRREGRDCQWCKRPVQREVQSPGYPPSAAWQKSRETERIVADRQPFLLSIGELAPGVCFDCIIRVYDAMRSFADAGHMTSADVHLGDDR